ncbi:Gfo/Idh/MocA family oxidoreductase [Streptomyces mobaraensis]|uniref:Gfo/Idh/MocA family protein n=1 Tax=Streptomyces mobaraensis TaxID=35621 RepID=UPI00332D31C7
MNTLKRAAMVGLGGQAAGDHLPGLAQCRLAELVGVCDIDADRVAVAADAYQVPGFTTVEHLLRKVRPDFVIAAVPHHAGRAVVAACAEAGVHMLKEKPFAIDPHEAAELVALCDESGIELMVTVQRRFHPVYAAGFQLLERIGIPYLVEGRYTFHCPDPAAGWRGRAELAGGGCLADMGYHLIDLLIWYLGLPDRVLADTTTAAVPGAEYDAEDTALVHLAYDHDLYGSLLISRSVGPKTERLTITGPHGTLAVERGIVRLLDPSGQIVETLLREPAWPYPPAALIDRFCRVLDGTAPNPSGPAAQLPHAAFLAAAYTSVATNRPTAPKEFLT